MSVITLENMEFHAYHGCLEHEKTFGNTFTVTLVMEVDTTLASKNDLLSDTVNYQDVYDTVKNEMEKPSELLEHVTRRIADSVFDKFPQIQSLNIRVSKLNPPLGGKVAAVSIETGRER
ncbi:MAG: dihydroneopterin aldolase [Paludibacter sp.]|nr:dihydroneopterin aldolase [Paludibacter sp.]